MLVRLSSSYRPSTRIVLILGATLLGFGAWSLLYQGAPPNLPTNATPQEGLAAILLQEHGLAATANNAVYMKSPTDLEWSDAHDYIPAFALARRADQPEDSPEDLYYLEVRPGSDGTPLQIRRLNNLTRTPYAREKLLSYHDHQALLSVEVFGQEQAVLLVDFRKDERDLSALQSKLDHTRYQISNLQHTGRFDGVGLRLFSIDPPPQKIAAVGDQEGFTVSLSAEKSSPGVLKLQRDGSMHINEAWKERIRYQPRYFASKTFTPWMVDTIRDLSWVGPRKIALLEQFVFRWADKGRLLAFSLGLLSEEGNLAAELGEVEESESASVTAGQTREESDWPPPDVQSAMKTPFKGEGRWTPVKHEWLRTLPGAPPAFYKTAVRMDPKRPYDNIVLIAADMRQLDINMTAGTVTPESSFGNRGSGLVPRDDEITNRLVAAFNGGFKTAHGAYGMIVDKTTILPPIPYSATLAVRDNGQVAMGTWYNSMTPPEDVKSLRQNLPPLLSNGRFNPTGKRKWGGTASDLDDIHTTRSAVGVRPKNTLVYAWCKSCSADSLGQALLAAGCAYGMHLDMNPTHTGWSYYRTDAKDLDNNERFKRFEVAKGSPNMDFKEERYIQRDVKDFFFLTLRQDLSSTLPPAPASWSPWETQHAAKGPEGFLAMGAVSRGQNPGDALILLQNPRMTAQPQRGANEPDPTQGLGKSKVRRTSLTLQGPTALLDLGISSLENPVGFLSEGRIFAPPIPGQPAVIVEADSKVRFLTPEEASAVSPSKTPMLRGGKPLLLQGEIQPTKTRSAPTRLHALGLDEDGNLLYLTQKSNDPNTLARTLQEARATTAMLLPPSPLGEDQSRLRFLRFEDQNLHEVDPLSGASTPLNDQRKASTHLYFEHLPEGPRAVHMHMEDVELTPAEARKQRRLHEQIKAMRQELRRIENAKYKAWIEKKNAQQK